MAARVQIREGIPLGPGGLPRWWWRVLSSDGNVLRQSWTTGGRIEAIGAGLRDADQVDREALDVHPDAGSWEEIDRGA